MKSLFVDYSLRFNRKNQLNANGEAVIQVRMYHNGKTKWYSLIPQLKTYKTDYRKDHKRFTLDNFDDFGKPIAQAT